MLKKITLTNFRQHVDRTFDFRSGLNAIRGENEAGKTTVLEAFTYFCFGAGALRESIDEVVTYHTPASRLRVDVELEHLGIVYTGYRGKSGAEVNFAGEKVVGQREVTKHFEALFGTSADMAGKLMFASQKSLAESLRAGPTAAGKMIEDLANFDLIDRVAQAIAERRPSGNTAAAEARVASLQQQVVQPVEEDLFPLEQEVLHAEQEVDIAEGRLAGLQAQRGAVDAAGARLAMREDTMRMETIDILTKEIASIDALLAHPAVVPPSPEALKAAREVVDVEKQYQRAAAAHKELNAAAISSMWDEDLPQLNAEIARAEADVRQLDKDQLASVKAVNRYTLERANLQREADVEIAQLEGRLIKETTCALCQKDLSDVPEVVRANSDIGRKIQARKVKRAQDLGTLDEYIRIEEESALALARKLQERRGYMQNLQGVVSANSRAEQVFARAADFIEVDRSEVPGIWRWVGPVIGGDRSDAAAQLAVLESEQRAAAADAVRRQEKAQQRAALASSRAVDIAKRAALDVESARQTIERAETLDLKLRAAQEMLLGHQADLQRSQSTLIIKQAVAAEQARQVARVKAQLLEAEKELAAMQRYNALIKKVRTARPVITDKLWNIVLAGVSKHFSEVRGVESSITRADKVFRCNGHPVSGLSGSAEDMLGLAMRITLTRTFLPGIDMLQLDEPAAACSDARETKMLGMLSTLGFGQTIIVSHSDLTDAVADHIINV